MFDDDAGSKPVEREGGKSPLGGKATPPVGGKATPPTKEKIDHTKCDIVPGQDTIIEIIKVIDHDRSSS